MEIKKYQKKLDEYIISNMEETTKNIIKQEQDKEEDYFKIISSEMKFRIIDNIPLSIADKE